MNFGNYNIPDLTQDALTRYVEHGIKPGGFLTAVLSNDLFGAFSRADPLNAAAMQDIVKFIYNELPAGAWGSPEKVQAFVKTE